MSIHCESTENGSTHFYYMTHERAFHNCFGSVLAYHMIYFVYDFDKE